MKNRYFIIFMLIGLMFHSCVEYVDGVDINPNAFTEAPGELVIGQAELTFVELFSGESNRLAGIFTDHFTGADRQFISYNNYNVTAGDFTSSWGSVYSGGYAQAKIAREDAQAQGNVVLQGIAEIMMAAFAGETTLLYGDVPFSQAADVDQFPDPLYDGQIEVLQGVQGLLSSALGNVGSATVNDFYGSNIFVSNDATWAEVAHSLKARYYLAAKNYEMALTEAQLGIATPNADLLSLHTSASGGQNLYYQFGALARAGYLTVEGSTLKNLVDGTTPRLLATPGDTERGAVYFDGIELNYTDGGYFAIDAPAHLVTWVETKLIEAEAAARTGGDGLTPFNAVRDYLATLYGGDFPHSTATGNDLILQILEEKYISLIGQLSVFSDVRRTGNALGVAIKSNTAQTIPQRFLYPQSEVDTNDNFTGLINLFAPTAINQ
ncbi:MAG: RagB/SusD family nutrient uptake outer membrane protein [Muricauda sp.]|nr:RagB/SusD family nutrient uptake outer membrane protein [Allomuricauda sp.]